MRLFSWWLLFSLLAATTMRDNARHQPAPPRTRAKRRASPDGPLAFIDRNSPHVRKLGQYIFQIFSLILASFRRAILIFQRRYMVTVSLLAEKRSSSFSIWVRHCRDIADIWWPALFIFIISPFKISSYYHIAFISPLRADTIGAAAGWLGAAAAVAVSRRLALLAWRAADWDAGWRCLSSMAVRQVVACGSVSLPVRHDAFVLRPGAPPPITLHTFSRYFMMPLSCA